MRDFYELTERGRARRLRAAVDAALTHYDLDVHRVRLITNETNGIFRLDTGRGPLVARVGLGGEVGHSPDELRAEVAWLAALAEAEIDVPAPVPTRGGELFTTVEVTGVPEPRNVVLFTWLPGSLLGDRLNDESVRAFGALSARLHRHGASFTPPSSHVLPHYDRVMPFRERDRVSDPDPEIFGAERADRFRVAADRVLAAVGALDRAGMQALHGDLHPWNVKIRRGRLAAFDFEDLMIGWPVQDVATTLYYFHGTPDFGRYCDAFEAGYRTVLPWPAASPNVITTFLIARSLVLANFAIASPELDTAHWLDRFDRRIAALVEGREFRITP